MKLWHWLVIGGGVAWFLLRRKDVPPAVPAAAAVPQPKPQPYNAQKHPSALIDLLQTRLDPAKRHKVITFNDGRILVETWSTRAVQPDMTQSFGSLAAAMRWAQAQPLSRSSAIVNWEWAGR